ncbi:glycosyltransferase [Candidatus Microgenomates bacterium]|nr:glycosyltransferase [Candidatus Microgenomates bacterium]
MRLYDWYGAQRVDQFISNSKNVAGRIKKFYRKESVVIYPPVETNVAASKKREDFYLIVSRIVGEKGIPMAMEAANKLGIKLKIVGEKAGLQWENSNIEKNISENIEFLGRLDDESRNELYATCKAFIVLEKDVDFGMTPVEAMACGAPVIAFANGGYLETVVDGKTGVFFDEYNVESLIKAIEKIDKLNINAVNCKKQAEKFSKEKFVSSIKEIVYGS